MAAHHTRCAAAGPKSVERAESDVRSARVDVWTTIIMVVSTGSSEPTKVISSADVKDVLCAGLPTTLLFLREFLVRTGTSRREALLGVAAPVVGCILRLRGTKRLTASEVVEAFSKDVSKTRNTTTKKKGGPKNNTEMRFFDDATLVNAYSILVLAASVLRKI